MRTIVPFSLVKDFRSQRESLRKNEEKKQKAVRTLF
jgi:hypothetical protein